jgi:formylglycine-generating enzyme required for sulfatase activity
MAGNVWQWTRDWYRPDYYRELASTGRVARNPPGPVTPLVLRNPTSPKKYTVAGLICAPTNIVPATSSAHAARAKSAPEQITSVFAAS